MSPIRSLRADDLPAIADLRRRVFRVSRQSTTEALVAYLRQVFLENPWREDGLPSLVCEDAGGRVIGFVGIVPRRMELRGQPLRVAVSTQFMVDPDSRGIAGVQLMQRLFAGPQDLTFGDAAPDAARKIWEGFGGSTAVLYSLFWHRSLRPLRDRASRWGQAPLTRAVRLALRPFLEVSDALLNRQPQGGGPHLHPPGTLEPVTPAGIVEVMPGVLRRRRLRPRYDAASIEWLLEHVTRFGERGDLRLRLVRDGHGKPAGWFVYFAGAGTATVVQLAAGEDHGDLVLAHLFHDAWRSGAIAVRGRLDPPLVTAMTAAGASLGRDGPWVLIQSRRPEVLEAFQAGDAFVTGLDGERWMGF